MNILWPKWLGRNTDGGASAKRGGLFFGRYSSFTAVLSENFRVLSEYYCPSCKPRSFKSKKNSGGGVRNIADTEKKTMLFSTRLLTFFDIICPILFHASSINRTRCRLVWVARSWHNFFSIPFEPKTEFVAQSHVPSGTWTAYQRQTCFRNEPGGWT